MNNVHRGDDSYAKSRMHEVHEGNCVTIYIREDGKSVHKFTKGRTSNANSK
jgi:hypothetical protein